MSRIEANRTNQKSAREKKRGEKKIDLRKRWRVDRSSILLNLEERRKIPKENNEKMMDKICLQWNIRRHHSMDNHHR